MKRDTCDRAWEIDALREGSLGDKDAEAFERHLRTCEACARTVARDERLRALASAVPARPPSELVVRRLRARILRETATGPAERSSGAAPFAVGGLFAIAVLAVWLVVRGRPAPVAAMSVAPAVVASVPADAGVSFAGSVTALDGARWTQSRDGAVEHVRLEEGTLTLSVRHQSEHERFLVDLPDGELEVRGTRFEIRAHAAVTESVRVTEGVVALRLVGTDEVVLTAGATWTRPLARVASPAAVERAPRDVPASASPARPRPAPAPVADDGSSAYVAASGLMRDARYDEAADAFRAYALAYPGASQAEDASFLEALALARAGRADVAALVAERHLSSYPRSFHRKDAAILVARAARDRGDCAKARLVLQPWLDAEAGADGDALAALRSCAPGP